MRHSDMINSIVEAEHHAREITDKAEEKRRHLDEEVAQAVCQMEKEYEESCRSNRPKGKRKPCGSGLWPSWKIVCNRPWTIWKRKARSNMMLG